MHDPGNGRSGGLLELAGDGQGGHHRGWVGPGGVAGVVEDWSGWQVVLAHAQRTDRVCCSLWWKETTSAASTKWDGMNGGVALETDQGTDPGDGGLVQGGVTSVGGG